MMISHTLCRFIVLYWIFTEVAKAIKVSCIDLHEIVSKEVTSIKRFVNEENGNKDKKLDAYVTVTL